ncbi:MAG: hypothetical protein GC182_06870 [Rhodopseudomonas sp.]|nr:hypothetical protein [Rhodopseudomonas sp.]
MSRSTATISESTATFLPRPSFSLRAILAGFWRALTRDAVPAYKPERHYMRGPGPAWQAKYGHLPSDRPQG